MLGVRRIVHHAAEIHRPVPRQMLQHVPGADLLSLVGRIGDAMREE